MWHRVLSRSMFYCSFSNKVFLVWPEFPTHTNSPTPVSCCGKRCALIEKCAALTRQTVLHVMMIFKLNCSNSGKGCVGYHGAPRCPKWQQFTPQFTAVIRKWFVLIQVLSLGYWSPTWLHECCENFLVYILGKQEETCCSTGLWSSKEKTVIPKGLVFISLCFFNSLTGEMYICRVLNCYFFQIVVL